MVASMMLWKVEAEKSSNQAWSWSDGDAVNPRLLRCFLMLITDGCATDALLVDAF